MSGHKLYTPKDFENMSWEEQDGNFLYDCVVNGGLNVCKVCGEAESGLDKHCRSNAKEVAEMKKDKEWLKDEVKTLFDKAYHLGKMEYYESEESIHRINSLVDQLDEPETLSQEWIDENKVARIDNLRKMTTSDVVTVENLKNILVPKQDKPVIPKFVADWIKRQRKFGYEDVFTSMTRLRGSASEKVIFWFNNNPDTYARAWMDGFEVEKEPHYYVAFEEFNLLYVTRVDIYGENGKFNYNSESNKNHAIKFTDKSRAKYLADFLGAIVVEVSQ